MPSSAYVLLDRARPVVDSVQHPWKLYLPTVWRTAGPVGDGVELDDELVLDETTELVEELNIDDDLVLLAEVLPDVATELELDTPPEVLVELDTPDVVLAELETDTEDEMAVLEEDTVTGRLEEEMTAPFW